MKILEDCGSLPDLSFSPSRAEVIPTGVLGFDCISGGGYPVGEITEIYGGPCSGKTASSLKSIARTQADGGVCVFVDTEHAFPLSLAKATGVDFEDLIILSPDSGEDAFSMMENIVKTGAVKLVILDSATALVSKEDECRKISDMESRASDIMKKCLPSFLPVLRASDTAAVFISQIRSNTGNFGFPTRAAGGAVLRRNASLRIETSCAETLGSKDHPAGVEITCVTTKSSSACPGMAASFDVLSSCGADDIRFFADKAERLGMLDFTDNNTLFFCGQELASYSALRDFVREDASGAFDRIREDIVASYQRDGGRKS